MSSDIRWKQRLSNLIKSNKVLQSALWREEFDDIQRAGLIQFFESVFELSWKTLKDFLEFEGYGVLNSPREVIKKAFQAGLITNAVEWLQGLEDRNLTTHVYDEETAKSIEILIRNKYAKLFEALVSMFEARL